MIMTYLKKGDKLTQLGFTKGLNIWLILNELFLPYSQNPSPRIRPTIRPPTRRKL